MILVDDRLGLDASAGRLADRVPGLPEGQVATTWTFHYRLVRALVDGGRGGTLTRSVDGVALGQVLDPAPSRLIVLDPRPLTAAAARMAVVHGLNVLAGELVAAAVAHQATVVLSEPNVGRRWPQVLADEGIELRVV